MARTETIQGFAVISSRGKYLDRHGKWREHGTLEEAYVHAKHVLMAGGAWAAVARNVYPAEYDPHMDVTRVIGSPMAYVQFVAANTPNHVSKLYDGEFHESVPGW